MNRKFVDWYVSQTMEVFDKGHDLKTIDIKFRSLVMKHLHAKWLIEAYNPMTSAAERRVGKEQAFQMLLKEDLKQI